MDAAAELTITNRIKFYPSLNITSKFIANLEVLEVIS